MLQIRFLFQENVLPPLPVLNVYRCLTISLVPYLVEILKITF